jgi:hypothetical protein
MDWSFVVQTRFPYFLWNFSTYDVERFRKLGTVLIVISPGQYKDWSILEQQKTESIGFRWEAYRNFREAGIPVSIHGEPYIPGFHKYSDFRDICRKLRSMGCTSYNTYNFHFTPHVAKRLVELRDPSVDIEKIHKYNQDKYWKQILAKLYEIADDNNIRLGCPDFVNSGPSRIEPFNTCCGINVANPCTFNTHYFKRLAQRGHTMKSILEMTDDGTADYNQALQILRGDKGCEFYTLRDAGILPKGTN